MQSYRLSNRSRLSHHKRTHTHTHRHAWCCNGGESLDRSISDPHSTKRSDRAGAGLPRMSNGSVSLALPVCVCVAPGDGCSSLAWQLNRSLMLVPVCGSQVGQSNGAGHHRGTAHTMALRENEASVEVARAAQKGNSPNGARICLLRTLVCLSLSLCLSL